MRYLVMIRKTPTGYSADVPDLPGCVATGRTVERTHATIAQALALHLQWMKQSGEVVPSPTSRLEFAVDEAAEEEFCTWVDVQSLESVSS